MNSSVCVCGAVRCVWQTALNISVCCCGSLMKDLFSTRSGENDVEYSGIMDLEEGEIPDEVIGATGHHLFYLSAHCSSIRV